MSKAAETLDLSKIRKGLQIEDEELLNKYLKEIWSDLSKRADVFLYHGFVLLCENQEWWIG